jgi:tetratricopeptide (TPR) repeat protein
MSAPEKNNRCSRWLLAIGCALLIAAFQTVHAAQPDLAKAEQLVRSGHAAQAYALLAPYEDQLAGETRYDYLLGIAALDSGKPDKATLAFERVLAVDPNFAGARLDMARAYFALGDITRAKTEFETVLAENPPPLARQTIQRYLEVIQKQEEAKKTAKAGYVELTYGRDTNVNNSTSQTQIAVPALGNLIFTLDSTNVKKADNYGMMGVGGEIAHDLGQGYAIFGGGDLRYRANQSEDRFDYKSASARTGFAWSNETDVVRTTFSGERYYLDNQPNRKAVGTGVDWRHGYDKSNFVNTFANFLRYRFDSAAIAVNNFDQYLVGVGLLRLFDEGRSALNASVFVGREDDTNGRADGNKNMHGVRVGGLLNLRDKLDLFVSVGLQRGSYDRENVAFITTRADNLYDGIAGLIWHLDRAWSLRPQVLYIHNDSNIPIYAYKRSDVSLTLRRDFR